VAGSDAYNRNLVGRAPNYADSYNRSLVGSIPKYPDPYNRGKVGNSNPGYLQFDLYSLRGSGAVNSGTKPRGLHTEYASGDADWDAAYKGDVIFYMVRADEGDAKDKEFDSDIGDVEDGYVWSETEGAMVPQGTPPPPDAGSVIPANAQGGPNPPAVQTAPQQVAAASSTGMTSAGPAGPSTGMNRSSVNSEPQSGAGRSLAGQGQTQTRSLEAPVGLATQSTARYSTQRDTAINVTQAVQSLSNNEVILNYPGSEVFFTDLLHASFNPGVSRSTTRSPQEIEGALASPKISDLSVVLAYASGGIRSSANLIQGINRGDLGLVTPKTMGQAERLGPQVSNTRYTR
jgi:hypothetical protein